jgi:hypothetical protein
VRDRVVEAHGDASSGQGHADQQRGVADGDLPAGVDGAVDLDGVIWSDAGGVGCGAAGWRSGGFAPGTRELGRVGGGEPGWDGLEQHARAGDVDGGRVDPQPHGVTGELGSQPQLPPGDPQVGNDGFIWPRMTA